MDKISKLLKKIHAKDRQRLLLVIETIMASPKTQIETKKIKNTDFYRIRSGKFRIIFHYDSNEMTVDSIKIRREDTYKNI